MPFVDLNDNYSLFHPLITFENFFTLEFEIADSVTTYVGPPGSSPYLVAADEDYWE